MKFELPNLPFAMDALEPHISKRTLEFHYGKHHQTYVNNLNNLIAGTEFENIKLEDIIVKSNGAIFNNAAQNYNHTFFWNCLSPNGGGNPKGKIAEVLTKQEVNFLNLQEEFNKAATGLFGSGWCWLVLNKDGKIEVKPTSNAGNPLTEGCKPLLVIDVWEHAYYLDYQNARPKFIDAFWNLVNWDFVNSNL
jgi:Fe-Mn family superoxide dismutase